MESVHIVIAKDKLTGELRCFEFTGEMFKKGLMVEEISPAN